MTAVDHREPLQLFADPRSATEAHASDEGLRSTLAPSVHVDNHAVALSSHPLQLAALDQALLQFRAVVAERGGQRDVHATAASGIEGGGGRLPHLAAIQKSFGHHDVSDVTAHTGAAADDACRDLGAVGYAMDGVVALSGAADLHTAAHEAAHVVQQRKGVALSTGVGQVGDRYEQHADAVADRVVRGESAVDLLDGFAGSGGGSGVQFVISDMDSIGLNGGPTAAHHDKAVAKLADVPSIHVGLERIARGLAYDNAVDEEQRYALNAWGFGPPSFVEGEFGLQFWLLPLRPDAARDPYVQQIWGGQAKPVIAFRGSDPAENQKEFPLAHSPEQWESGERPKEGKVAQADAVKFDARMDEHQKDWGSDSERGGVGGSQFYSNLGMISDAVASLAAQGPVLATGHSLGGALAQQAASQFPGLISEVVTFNAPAIRADQADGLREHNASVDASEQVLSTHYQDKHDVVDDVGKRLTPGRIRLIENNVDVLDPGGNHTSMLLDGLVNEDGSPRLPANPDTGYGGLMPFNPVGADGKVSERALLNVQELDPDEYVPPAEDVRGALQWFSSGQFGDFSEEFADASRNASRVLDNGGTPAEAEAIIDAIVISADELDDLAHAYWTSMHNPEAKVEELREHAKQQLRQAYLGQYLAHELKGGDAATALAEVEARFQSEKGRPMSAAERQRAQTVLGGGSAAP